MRKRMRGKGKFIWGRNPEGRERRLPKVGYTRGGYCQEGRRERETHSRGRKIEQISSSPGGRENIAGGG